MDGRSGEGWKIRRRMEGSSVRVWVSNGKRRARLGKEG
jgi:hypothetical protein